jgi:hypothetical protein
MAARRSGLKGAGKVRRLLKRLPDESRASIVAELQRAAPVILSAARAETPVRTGGLRQALEARVFPKTMRLRVGLLTKAKRKKFFYGWILEAGRKAQTVRVRRANSRWYHINVKAISPRKFDIVEGRTKALARRLVGPALDRAFRAALSRAAAGNFDG